RGRSPATRRMAHQAWLMLASPEARQAHAVSLLPGEAWATALRQPSADAESIKELGALADTQQLDWTQLLSQWYDIAFVQSDVHAGLLAVLRELPLQPGYFKGIRQVLKAAELRRDAECLGVLHARFENTPANFRNHGVERIGVMIGSRWTRLSTREEFAKPVPRIAFGSRTRDYLRRRNTRHARRLMALDHPAAVPLVVQLLLGLRDADQPAASSEQRWTSVDGRYTRVTRHYPSGSRWLVLHELLLARHPDVRKSERASRWHSMQPLATDTAPTARSEPDSGWWDRHPQALMALAVQSRSALVQAVVARALADHLPLLKDQPTAVLTALLKSPYAPTAALGFQAVRALVEAGRDAIDVTPWLVLLVQSPLPEARQFALLHIASYLTSFARHAPLVVALLLADDAAARRQGAGLATLTPSNDLVAELQAALLAIEPDAPALSEVLTELAALLEGPLASAARHAPVEPLLCLLDHAATPVMNLAAGWLLAHDHGAALVPGATLERLLGEEDPERRAVGVRLLAALPDSVLRSQVGLLADLVLHPHAALRAAVRPTLERLCDDPAVAVALAERLHASLFVSEEGEGQHDDALQWLTTRLQAHAPARDPGSVWRALQARSTGAQRYGAWALPAIAISDYSLRQHATLGRHADVSVRQWALCAIDSLLGAQPTPEQVAQLLPLGDTLFDDARAYAFTLFGERLGDDALTPELLITWIDHPQPWMQSLGRSRLVRRMTAGEASLCLTRLSQHPSTQVQLFITQWLLELPRDNPAELAERLRALRPYFLTVLSQVHRGRAAKTRVTDFLRGLIEHADTAAVVAEIFARQVVSASLTDKPQYIAGLRDIAARHPQIALPFIAWKPVTAHTTAAAASPEKATP
ncbi:MAG: hypothetical protein RLZZ618_1325, partial [Pseudomonadota bacterium]